MNNRMAETLQTYRAHQWIVQTIRDTIPQIKHYDSFSGNRKRIQAKLEKALDGYTVRVSTEGHGIFVRHEINVWGIALTEFDALRVSWSVKDGAHWTDGLLEDLDRQDPTDTLERFEAEKVILDQLTHLEETIRACKESATQLIESLPVPPTALARNFRSEPHFWNRLSYPRLKENAFPNLFGTTE